MIASLEGTLTSKSPTEITLNVHGVGYGISIPVSTYERIGEVNSTVVLLTYLHVREDVLQLYGFATEEERSVFRLLISVSGIGPKMAQGILSGISTAELRNHITQANLGALTSIPGVGKKTAERLVVELRDKLGKIETEPPLAASDTQTRVRAEALLALTSLGYTRVGAERALRAAIHEMDGKDVSIELLIKASLRHATK